MKFSTTKKDDFAIIELLEDKIIATNAPDLKAEFVLLHSSGFHNIICDLSSVGYVDSSGLSAFLVAHRICTADNGVFVLAEIPESVAKLIKLTQLNSVLSITNSVEEAESFILSGEFKQDIS